MSVAACISPAQSSLLQPASWTGSRCDLALARWWQPQRQPAATPFGPVPKLSWCGGYVSSSLGLIKRLRFDLSSAVSARAVSLVAICPDAMLFQLQQQCIRADIQL